MFRTLGRVVRGRAVYPAIVLARGEGSVFRRLRELEQVQWLGRQELQERQDGRLGDTLAWAASRSPFYRARLAHAGTINAKTARSVLTTLPFVTKADLQAHYADMLASPRPGRVSIKTTGGSTGQPVTLAKNRSAIAGEMAASWLAYGWFGVRPGDRAVRFWGNPATLKRRLRYAAADFAMHRIRFSAFAFDHEDLARYWRRCQTFGPDYFYGYVSMLEAFAQFVRRQGIDGSRLGLKAIITTAEVLSPVQRELLESVFSAPVQNEYGCGEVGPIAYGCPAGSLHLMSDNTLVELITPDGRPAGPGEVGEIVVTDLNNRALPLIRYRIGDMAEHGEPCSCRRGFPVLKRVFGRAYDFVEGPDGRRYHGEFFMYLFEDLRSSGLPIAQFQVVQRNRAELDVSVVVARGDVPAVNRAVSEAFRLRIPGMRTTVMDVPRIERRASGKMLVVENRYAQTNVASDTDDA